MSAFAKHHAVSVRHPGADRHPAAAVLPADALGGVRERAVHHDARAVRLAGAVDT